MSDVEEIEAAIAKLNDLRAESTQPVDGQAWIQGREAFHYEDAREVYTGPNEYSRGSADIVRCYEPVDAELIVTLHRTIDAQLRVLQFAKYSINEGEWSEAHLPALLLARAINGTT